MSDTFIIAGGDKRSAVLAEEFAVDSKVFAIGFDNYNFTDSSIIRLAPHEALPECDHLILPVPVTSDGININAPFGSAALNINNLCSVLPRSCTVFGGSISPSVKETISSYGFKVIDYLQREELTVMNALATAEGALAEVLNQTDFTLSGKKVIILGMGRIAKSLIRLLNGFGTDTTVFARKPSDLAWAKVLGCKAQQLDKLETHETVKTASVIFNTIPALVLSERVLKNCPKDCFVEDLASKPGGTDFAAAKALGIKAVLSSGLPGKTAPITAGKAIADTIKLIIKENSHDSPENDVQ